MNDNLQIKNTCAYIQRMETIGSRLDLAMREAGYKSQMALSNVSKVPQPTISRILKGINEPEAATIAALAVACRVATEWLATGRGNKYIDGKAFVENVEPAEIGSRRIPLIDYVQAGAMAEVTNPFPVGDAYDWLYTDLDLSDTAFALTVKGDSMEPDYKEGDRIIVDPNIRPQPGDVVIAKNSEEEATFKKYRVRGSDHNGNEIFELVPINEDYSTLRSDETPLRVIGTVMEHRKYRRR